MFITLIGHFQQLYQISLKIFDNTIQLTFITLIGHFQIFLKIFDNTIQLTFITLIGHFQQLR